LGSYFQKTNLVNITIFLIVGMHMGISICIRNSNLLSYIASSVWILFLPVDNFHQHHRRKQQKHDNDEGSRNNVIGDGGNNTNDNDNDNATTCTLRTSTTRTRSTSSSSRISSLVTYILVGCMVGGNIWFETIGTDCSTESSRLIWSTLLQNRWNVFIGAEEVSVVELLYIREFFLICELRYCVLLLSKFVCDIIRYDVYCQLELDMVG